MSASSRACKCPPSCDDFANVFAKVAVFIQVHMIKYFVCLVELDFPIAHVIKLCED